MKFINQNFLEVRKLQEQINEPQTGFADSELVLKLEKYYNAPLIQHNGKLVPLKGFEGNIIHELSLHELPDFSNNWEYRRNIASSICLHHIDISPRTQYCLFHRPTYKHLSTHFLVGRHPITKAPEVLQCLDTTVAAQHIGKTNEFTISVDLCQVYDYTGYVDEELMEYSKNFITALHETVITGNKKPLVSTVKLPVSELQRYSLFASHNVSISKENLEPYMERFCEGVMTNV
jgi:hypothetical protein